MKIIIKPIDILTGNPTIKIFICGTVLATIPIIKLATNNAASAALANLTAIEKIEPLIEISLFIVKAENKLFATGIKSKLNFMD